VDRFRNFAAIDWSGAVGPRQAGIAVALCGAGNDAPALVRPGHVWSRHDVLDWLINEMPDDTLVGMDLSPAFPFADAGAYFPEWSESPADAIFRQAASSIMPTPAATSDATRAAPAIASASGAGDCALSRNGSAPTACRPTVASILLAQRKSASPV
jgi:hypothetical protein